MTESSLSYDRFNVDVSVFTLQCYIAIYAEYRHATSRSTRENLKISLAAAK